MNKKNVVCSTKYERIVHELANPIERWEIQKKDGSREVIAKKKPIWFEDYQCMAYPFGHDFISNRLKAYRFNLNHYEPMFISAQTGAGKTSFCFEQVYQLVRKRKMKLMVILSRSPLKTKAKYDAIDAAGTDQRDLLTNLGIEKEHHFGDIDVFSYQDFSIGLVGTGHKSKIDFSEYGAVIFDEAHFFTSDSDFNVSTQYIMDYLIDQAFQKRVPRIYMTGTPYDVFDRILEKERELWYRDFYPTAYKMHVYHFERDYSYIQILTFKDDMDHSDIINKIAASDSASKWLIFVESKEVGFQLSCKLSGIKKEVIFLYSELLHNKNKKDHSIQQFLKELTDNERMACDVLIATKCLDVGVTIKDKNVNIVSFLHDRVDFLQSLGRKRVSADETVNLLIPEYTKERVEQWLHNTEQRLAEYKQKCELYPLGESAKGISFEMPIYVDNGRYKHNTLMWYKLQNTRRMLQCILKKLETSDQAEYTVIAESFSEWMPGCKFLSQVQTDKTLKEIQEVIESYRASVMDENKFAELKEQLKPFDSRVDQRADRKGLSTRTVNTIIGPLGLMITHDKKNGIDIYKIVPQKNMEEK